MAKENYDKKPLYEDKQIKINYFQKSPEDTPSFEDHALIIKDRTGETQYVLQRGVLAELARTPRGDLWAKIDAINPLLPHHVKKEEIGIDGLHVALCQAHIEEERRYSDQR